jgi:GNAT superfamily N-acetyltransferase
VDFRRFVPHDAEFCFKVRSAAFIQKFNAELSPEEVTAGVNAYLPHDYSLMAERIPLFIVEDQGTPLGFFAIKRKDNLAAELLLIYIDLNHLGRGIGSACIQFIEKWLSTNWPEIRSLIVDTVIPEYNRKFYQRLGFSPDAETFCEFAGVKVKALRLCKKINHENTNQTGNNRRY